MKLVSLLSQSLSSAHQNIDVHGMCLDSRQVKPGDAFVALQGAQTHGMRFASAVADAGAAVILSDGQVPSADVAIPVIEVANLAAQLGQLANRFYATDQRSLRCIGVTGTNGKTSSVQLIAQALDLLQTPCATIGTLGFGFAGELTEGARTTPDVFNVHAAIAGFDQRGAKALAMEVSSHALDQRRVDLVPYQIASFTNLTRDHLDYHPDMQHYFEAKAKLFAWPSLQAAVINIDDAYGAQLAESLQARSIKLWRYSAHANQNAELVADAIKLHAHGIEFTLNGVAFTSKLIGRFNVENLAGVIAVLCACGFPLASLPPTIAQLQPVNGRMNKIESQHASAPLVVVDYAHTPDALEKALRSVREHTRGQVVCVFGCGGDRDRGKRPLMAAAVDQYADRAVLTSDNPRSEDPKQIAADALAGFSRIKANVELDRAVAIERAIAAAGANDAVLIAGKGHERYQEISGVMHAFDDREHAERALQAWQEAA
jgi:UDP-N-acetylmuramoyl-L-alanyl-D-glutamate--2,6-diaminopimelate ligase